MSWPLPLATKEQAALPNDAKLLDLMKGAEARRLFKLEQLEVNWDEQAGALWTFMRPRGRPSYNPDFLEDFHAWQRGISAIFADRPDDIHYLLLGSRTPGAGRLWRVLRAHSGPEHGDARPADDHDRVGARRRARRRLRVAAVVQRHYSGTRRQVRLPGDYVRTVPRHGRLQHRVAPGRRGLRRGDDAHRPHLQRRGNERGRLGARGGRARAGGRSRARLHA